MKAELSLIQIERLKRAHEANISRFRELKDSLANKLGDSVIVTSELQNGGFHSPIKIHSVVLRFSYWLTIETAIFEGNGNMVVGVLKSFSNDLSNKAEAAIVFMPDTAQVLDKDLEPVQIDDRDKNLDDAVDDIINAFYKKCEQSMLDNLSQMISLPPI